MKLTAMNLLGGRIKDEVYRLLPLGALQRAMPRQVIGIHYHVVSPHPLPHVRHLYRYKTPEQFEDDLIYLKENCRLLSYDQLVAGRQGNGPMEPNAVLLSFDDGYAECFSVVRPLLLLHQVPCTFFVVTGFLDNRRLFYRNLVSLCIERFEELPSDAATAFLSNLSHAVGITLGSTRAFVRWAKSLDEGDPGLDEMCDRLGVGTADFLKTRQPFLTSDQVRALAADGFTIGAHTETHPDLRRVRSEARIRQEIVGSCRTVRELVRTEEVPFAFPFSGSGVSRDLLTDIRAEHPEVGLIFDTGKLRRDRPFIIHRITVERPPVGGSRRSTIPNRLRAAYLKQMWRTARDGLHRTENPEQRQPS